MMVSCICATYGRVLHLEEALQCFLDQKYSGQRELLIYNTFDQQKLRGEFPNVRIINALKRPPNLGACWNAAIAEARGDIIVYWPDDDLYLDNHIANFASRFDEGTQWVWLSHHWFMLSYRIKGLNPGGHKLVAFTKAAWQAIGGYPMRDCGCERDFTTKLICLPGKRVQVPPKEVTYIRHWGNGAFHISGMGDDHAGRASGHDRIASYTKALAASGAIPTGEVELQPSTLHDYRRMTEDIIAHPDGNLEPEPYKVIGVGDRPPYTGDVEKLKPWPSITLVYINVPSDTEHINLASRFLSSYIKCPPGLPHETMIVCNGIGATEAAAKLYGSLPKCTIFQHDDTGWDIGAFIAAAKVCTTDIMVCLGGQSYFKRGGWLIRMVEAWKEYGPGMYGSLASYEISPHMNTSGFWCSPKMLQEYPKPVVKAEDRYNFEHGPDAMWKITAKKGFPVMLVTWDRAYTWIQWREPRNGFRAGDQSDCLTYFKHTHIFDNTLEPQKRSIMRQAADTLSDMTFIKARNRRDVKLATVNFRPAKTRIELPFVTLWGCCWSDDAEMQSKTIRVLRYCSKKFEFGKIILFSHLPVPRLDFAVDVVKIAQPLNMKTWNGFVNHSVPRHIKSAYAMSVHEDGFPIRTDLWSPEFLDYDYIGAPWLDGVVGNGGFNIESRRLLTEKLTLPPSDEVTSDYFVCRVHRQELERRGIRFAPTPLAEAFSTELTGHEKESFGFHGRTLQPAKYSQGWKIIEQSES